MSEDRDIGEAPPTRLWLLCFSDGATIEWWQRFLKPGFRHVCACCYYADIQMWVYYNPTRRGTEISVMTPNGFDARWAQIIQDSSAILRFPNMAERRTTPLSWWCVGAIKALLGIKSKALTPFMLYNNLLNNGAEIVELQARQVSGQK